MSAPVKTSIGRTVYDACPPGLQKALDLNAGAFWTVEWRGAVSNFNEPAVNRAAREVLSMEYSLQHEPGGYIIKGVTRSNFRYGLKGRDDVFTSPFFEKAQEAVDWMEREVFSKLDDDFEVLFHDCPENNNKQIQ